MGTGLRKAEAAKVTYSVDLPVIVEADDVHRRYCASLVIDGQPDRTLHGEYRILESSSIDSEQQKQLAIDDLRRKVLEKLTKTTDR